MNKYLVSLLLATFLMGNCTPISTSPAALPTATVPPTITPFPTPSAISTVTPYPPLQTDGPYLLFTYDNKNFTIMDADGMGRKFIQIPQNTYIPKFENAVSPNGEWIVYYTGTTEQPYDLALNLFNLKNKSTVRITNLMATGYPKNLEPLTELIPFDAYHADCLNSLECKLGVIELGFKAGIRSFDWAPNSNEIAFAAQIDGPSSDIYVYSIEEKSIQRLTKELENIGGMINWAPSGEKILYSSEEPHINYPPHPLRIADPKMKSLQNPREIDRGVLFWFGEGWIDENSYFLWDGGEGAPPHRFRYINTKTQQVSVFWEYWSDGFVYLKDLGGIVVNIHPNQEDAALDSIEPGTYFVSLSGERIKLSDDRFFPVGKQSLEDSFFFTTYGRLYTVKLDGSFSQPMSENINPADISVSSNKEWFVLNKNNTQLELYSKYLQLIQSWDIESYETIWRPDSSGFFLNSYPNIHYVTINEKELELVNVCPSKDCSIRDYVWLP